MKKLFFIPLLILGSIGVSKAQTAADPNAPKMSFEVLEHNFGSVKQGESVTYVFKFRNSGKTPLTITNAQGSCGCTVPEYPKEPIAAGGSGSIKVTFNSAGKQGMQDKTVTLTHNGGTDVLHMKGNVEVPATTPTPSPDVKPAPATPAPASGTTRTSTSTTPAKSSDVRQSSTPAKEEITPTKTPAKTTQTKTTKGS